MNDKTNSTPAGHHRPPNHDGSIWSRMATVAADYLKHYGIPVLAVQCPSVLLMVSAGIVLATQAAPMTVTGLVFFLGALTDMISRQLQFRVDTSRPEWEVTLIVIRYIGYGVYFSGLGLAAYLAENARVYIFAVPVCILSWGYLALLESRIRIADTPGLCKLAAVFSLHNAAEQAGAATRLLAAAASLLQPFNIAVICLLASLFNLTGPLFWLALTLLALHITSILLRVYRQDEPDSRQLSRSSLSFLFYLMGGGILLVLVARLPFQNILVAFETVGPEVMILILFPAIWVIPYAMTLIVLLDKRISFRDALYTQITGDAFNSITPLLGMGGEPYKARHLSRFVSLHDSSHAIIQSRLIHALSGVFLTAVVLALCLAVVDFSSLPGLRPALLIVIILMMAAAGLILWVTMSQAPSRLAGFVLRWFKLIEDVRHDDLSWKKLLTALLFRIIGRGGKLMELYLIFLVLNITPDFADLVLVEGMILTSISLFFFVPQGLGVNEAGIVTAFTIAGYPAATAVVFGLIRRARMVVYALMGLTVYLIGSYGYRRQSRD